MDPRNCFYRWLYHSGILTKGSSKEADTSKALSPEPQNSKVSEDLTKA